MFHSEDTGRWTLYKLRNVGKCKLTATRLSALLILICVCLLISLIAHEWSKSAHIVNDQPLSINISRADLRAVVSIPIPDALNLTSQSHSEPARACLVIILGQTRAHQLTWPSFQRYFLDETHCDLALSVGSNEEDESNPFYRHAKYIWKWDETQFAMANDSESWTHAFEYLYNRSMAYFPQRLTAKHRHKWIDRVFYAGNISRTLGPTANQIGSGGIQLFFRLFAYLNIVELGLVQQYKYMMHTRSDYKYLCKFPWMELTRNETEIDTIWITSGEAFGGVTDRNLLASTPLFMSAIDVLLSMFMEYETWNRYMVHVEPVCNVETALATHFLFKGIEQKVRYYDQPMFAVRANNTWTRWSSGSWLKQQHLAVKYIGAYRTALKVCALHIVVNPDTNAHDEHTATPPPMATLQQYQQLAGSATSGKSFSMDSKKRHFTDTRFMHIRKSQNAAKIASKSMSSACRSEYWIVLTTIFNVTSAIFDYNAMDTWCTVIVGDSKSMEKRIYDSYLNVSKVIYLDVDAQRHIFGEMNTFNITPFNHFGRKNLGYLYAMMNGAKYIYDTDDDNKVVPPFNKRGIPIYQSNANLFKLSVRELSDERINDTFNVFLLWTKSDDHEHFIWPRGYDISVLPHSFQWHKRVQMRPISFANTSGDESEQHIITQWLSNIEPDFDALQRLIGKNVDFHSAQFTKQYLFDSAPSKRFAVSIPNRVYVPFNAQMTVWQRQAFLFLYLPITVHGRVSDIWRSYFAQTVMHILELNGVRRWKLLYAPVLVDQFRNSHNYLADFQSELPLYLQTHALLSWLHRFAMHYKVNAKHVSVGQILLDLYVALYEYDIIQEDDVKGVYLWIHDIVDGIGISVLSTS